jgi:hypothetical protein
VMLALFCHFGPSLALHLFQTQFCIFSLRDQTLLK